MRNILSLCSLLLAAGSLFAQQAQPTVQGHPHPYGQIAGFSARSGGTVPMAAAQAGNFTMDDIEYWVGEGSSETGFNRIEDGNLTFLYAGVIQITIRNP